MAGYGAPAHGDGKNGVVEGLEPQPPDYNGCSTISTALRRVVPETFVNRRGANGRGVGWRDAAAAAGCDVADVRSAVAVPRRGVKRNRAGNRHIQALAVWRDLDPYKADVPGASAGSRPRRERWQGA